MIKKLFIICLFCLCVGSVSARKADPHGAVAAGGYKFWLAVPDDLNEPKPLVIFLHGASLCGNDLNQVKRYGTIDAIERGRNIDAYVVAPQNPGGSWKPAKIKEIMDWAIKNQNVDPNRVYVLGMSLGGYGTIDFAATYPDEIAAAIAMCGGGTVKNISNLGKLPLWIVHGTGDNAVAVSQSDRIVDIINNSEHRGTRLIYDRIPGMNHSQPARMFYIPEVYEWLFLHDLSQDGRPLHETVRASNSFMQSAYSGLNFSGKSKTTSAKKSKNSKKSSSKVKASKKKSSKTKIATKRKKTRR